MPLCPFFVRLLDYHFTGKGKDVGVAMVQKLQNTRYSLDEKLEKSFINLFGRGPAAQSIDSDANGNVISASQDDQGDANGFEQVDEGTNIANADTMDNDGHSECSSDSEGDNDDDIQQRDHDVELREEVEFCNGRLRRKAVSSNFQDDIDDEVSYFSLSSYQ